MRSQCNCPLCQVMTQMHDDGVALSTLQAATEDKDLAAAARALGDHRAHLAHEVLLNLPLALAIKGLSDNGMEALITPPAGAHLAERFLNLAVYLACVGLLDLDAGTALIGEGLPEATHRAPLRPQ